MLKILYEDNHLIGAVKPAGFLSQGDGGSAPDMLSAVGTFLAGKYNKPGKAFVGLVHRLDRNVGGTMIFAKTSKGASRASEDIREGFFYKGYFALTGGEPCGGAEGFMRHRLEKNPKENRVYLSANGKECVLYYRKICDFNDLSGAGRSVYFVIPLTGRAHQIRAQFALSGAPLAGDAKYGGSGADNGPERQIGLWSSFLSVRKTTDRSGRIWLSSLPEGTIWLDGRGVLPAEIASFAGSGMPLALFESVKRKTGDLK